MFPQTLSLPAHFPPGFGESGSPTRAGGHCANGKPIFREESTGHLWCVCQLTSPSPSLAHLPSLSAPPHPPHPHPHSHPHPHPHPKASSSSPSPPHLPVQVPLPPFTAARGAVSSNPLAANGVNKDFLSTRTIPLGGPYTAAAFATYHPYLYPGYDMGARKIAVRETTGPLKAWLLEHRKNPYPTKAEKIMLAIITQMTLTQVSTWFANARRRLKKETGGGQWDSVSDCESGSRADRPSDDSPPPSQKDGSSLGDHYEDLSDVDDNDDVTSFQLEASSSTTPDVHSHPHSPPHQSHPYHFHPTPLSYPHNLHANNTFPLSLVASASVPEPTSAASNDVMVTSASSARDNKNEGGDVNRPKPRIWSISSMLGLEEEGEKGEERGGKTSEEGSENAGSGKRTWERSTRTQCSPASASSPDCSSSGSSEQDLQHHGETRSDTKVSSSGTCSRDLESSSRVLNRESDADSRILSSRNSETDSRVLNRSSETDSRVSNRSSETDSRVFKRSSDTAFRVFKREIHSHRYKETTCTNSEKSSSSIKRDSDPVSSVFGRYPDSSSRDLSNKERHTDLSEKRENLYDNRHRDTNGLQRDLSEQQAAADHCDETSECKDQNLQCKEIRHLHGHVGENSTRDHEDEEKHSNDS